MDRLTRKELKTDKFAQEVGHSVEFVTEHRKQVTMYGGIAVAVILVAAAIYGFMQYRKTTREADLRAALKIQEAPVGQTIEGIPSYATQADKDKALVKALTDAAAKDDGTDQGAVAHYYLGSYYADKGDLSAAEKNFKNAVETGGKDYSSLAKLSLATIYKSEGKQAEGEQLLRSVVANPTIFVSKEEATIQLARYMASYNPQEARKLLEPLRTERSVVSRMALAALSELPAK